jgi:hypothetical protein
VTRRRLPRRSGGVALLVVLPCVLLLGCTRSVEGHPSPGPEDHLPGSAAELEPLIVSEVPSGLPRLPDEELHPPAGEKDIDDVADYADDPAREREVLEDYGYRYGWERFWGSDGGPMTGVFVDQFAHRAGAGAYVEDLARNDAAHYRGMLREEPPWLPGGCRALAVDDPDPGVGLTGPAAFAWCTHGAFSVAVTAVAGSVDAAQAEVQAVMAEQLERLPPR